MKIEFDVNKNIELPSVLFEKRAGDYFIILASEYPNWIILNNDEYKLLQYLETNNLMNSLLNFQKDTGSNDDEILAVAQSLLTKIELNKFYSHTPIVDEEKIYDITKKLHINLTNKCNLRCKHCYLSPETQDILNLDYNKLKLFLDNLYSINGKTEVVISGGEPLCYDNIFELLDYLRNKGHKVILFSNGTMINKENIRYLKNNCDEVQLSLEGISEYYYESIRGKGTYSKLLNAIDLIKGTDIKLTLAITVLNNVFDDIENELLFFLEIINTKNISIRFNDEIEFRGNAKNLDQNNFIFDINKKIRLVNLINKLARQGYCDNSSKERNIHFSNCGIGTNIVINFDEKVYPCSMYELDYFNLDTDIVSIINHFNALNEDNCLEKISFCTNCELKYLCAGGCKIKNYIEKGSYIEPYCTEKIKEKKLMDLLLGYQGEL